MSGISKIPNRDYPQAAFEVGNIFDIPASDKSAVPLYADLFEHLSVKGMQRGFEEVARVTQYGCSEFFQRSLLSIIPFALVMAITGID